MNRPESDSVLERYLGRVRASLRGMPAREVDDIVLELRGHVVERLESEADLDAVLRSLGDPEEIARQYRGERVTARAEGGGPIAILHGLVLLRRRSVAGWIALVLAAFGYAWALALIAASIEKILSPRDVGLWQAAGEALPRIMIDGPGPPGDRELLGWWFVPLGLAAGILLLVLTKRLALWWIRRSRAR